jgi:hypothetical protein
MKFFVVLRDSKKINADYKIRFKILDNPLAKQWADLFLENFVYKDHPIEKDYSLKGWVDSWESHHPRNLEFLCDQMNRAISNVNESMVPLGYEKIDISFDLEKLKSQDRQILMNKIHHHFETLIGQTWNPSKWFKMLINDSFTKTQIRLLNNLCHEIESIIYTIENKEQHHLPMHIFGSLNGPNFEGNYLLDKIKKELTIQEYQSFSKFRRWGDVEIYYAQLGKRHVEAYYDNDKEIHDSNISGYRYLTGEFVINFDPKSFNNEIYEDPKFHQWLVELGYDINDPTLALGFPRVAEIELQESKMSIIENIQKRDDIFQLGLEDDNGKLLYYRTYNYFWNDISVDKILQRQ